MLIYDSVGPNPRALRMFQIEKGLDLPKKEINLLAEENRKKPYTDLNPGGQMPALQLDNGSVIGETVAIFEYLEEKHPTPHLIGATPEERAETRQWQRRIELNITEHLYNGFRYGEGVEMFKTRMRVLPEAASGLKTIVQEKLQWLSDLMGSKQFIVGNRFTVDDIILFCALDFGAGVGQKIPPKADKVQAWFERVAARPSAEKSLSAAALKAGFRG